jgi:hypothetical protein
VNYLATFGWMFVPLYLPYVFVSARYLPESLVFLSASTALPLAMFGTCLVIDRRFFAPHRLEVVPARLRLRARPDAPEVYGVWRADLVGMSVRRRHLVVTSRARHEYRITIGFPAIRLRRELRRLGWLD